MVADNLNDMQQEEDLKESKSSISTKDLLGGSLLAEKVKSNIFLVLFIASLGICYIANVYATERLHREKIALEKKVKDLRFESITTAAGLMFIRKQSEVIKRIKSKGLRLEESKEPPVKLYRR